jgi:SHS family lactate transporter-like MFS transporter
MGDPVRLRPASPVQVWNEVSPDQRRTLFATWTGWVLDAFDFTILLLVVPDIAREFKVSLLAVSGVITATLFCRLFGGLAFGTWADRVGRRLPLMISVLAFSVFSFLSGLAPTFAVFFVIRMLFGVGMGGEWAAGTPLAMESWPQRYRGVASGFLQGGWPVGYLLATVVYFIVYPMFGWRALFFVGVLPALLVLYVRSRVPESPEWSAQQLPEQGSLVERVSLLRLFKPDLLSTSLHAFVVMGAMMCSYYALNALWPTFLTNQLHLTVGERTLFVIVLNIGSLLGYWFAGWWSEQVGRRTTLVAYAVVGILCVPLYTLFPIKATVLVGGFLIGAVGIGLWGVIPAYLAERFPTAVRGAGPGTAYHVGAAIGSFAPTVVALIAAAGLTLGQAIAIGGAVSLAMIVLSVGLGPETRGRPLRFEAEAEREPAPG